MTTEADHSTDSESDKPVIRSGELFFQEVCPGLVEPIAAAEEVERVLSNYRDAMEIQGRIDQATVALIALEGSLRGIKDGKWEILFRAVSDKEDRSADLTEGQGLRNWLEDLKDQKEAEALNAAGRIFLTLIREENCPEAVVRIEEISEGTTAPPKEIVERLAYLEHQFLVAPDDVVFKQFLTPRQQELMRQSLRQGKIPEVQSLKDAGVYLEGAQLIVVYLESLKGRWKKTFSEGFRESLERIQLSKIRASK